MGLYGGVDPAKVQADYAHVLIPGERVEYACKTIRDMFIVTDRRILNVDKQGLTGTKKNYDSIVFDKIGRFAVEFGGKLAGMVTVRIWASGAGEKLEVVFDKTANGKGIQKFLAAKLLGSESLNVASGGAPDSPSDSPSEAPPEDTPEDTRATGGSSAMPWRSATKVPRRG